MSALSGFLGGSAPESGHLRAFIVRYGRRLAFGLSCVVITNAITLAGPWILKHAIDDLGIGITDTKLIYYGTLLIAAAVASGATRFITRRALIGASRGIEYDIRNAFFAHLERLPLGVFHARRTGDLMSRATNDLSAVRMMAGPAVMYTATTALTFVVALAVMLSIDWRLTLIALLPLPPVTLASRYFGRMIHERFERIQAQLSDLSAVTQEALAGVRVVRAYRQESRELQRFRDANLEYVERNRALIRLQGLYYPSMGFFMGCAEALVLWRGSLGVIDGRLTIGELVAFSAYLSMLAWPMIAFGWVTNLVQRGRASWGRMREILEIVPAIDDRHVLYADLTPADIRGDIRLESLSFTYGGAPVLNNISLTIQAGQTVGIVGRTGSGKSTLLSLLARLHDPPPGTVFVDGKDVREIPLSALRGAIGVVPQEPFLFSDTIAGNVAFGQPEMTGLKPGPTTVGEGAIRGPGSVVGPGFSPAEAIDRIAEVSAIAQLDKDVAEFPRGYDTRIGERGITLSGGQKQRTALARALYIDPRILILDDALASVDTHTEDDILDGLRRYRRGRTALIVAHRLSTVRDADLIVVLEGGTIVEQGTHATLVAKGGVYAETHRQQLIEQELDVS